MTIQNPKMTTYPSAEMPAVGAVAISYGGGDQVLSVNSRSIYIGTAGALKVDMADGTSTQITFSNLAAGQVYPFSVSKIYQSGSTAAGVVLL